MNTVPSVDDLLEGFIIAINNEIMPFLNNPKAVATAAMSPHQRCWGGRKRQYDRRPNVRRKQSMAVLDPPVSSSVP